MASHVNNSPLAPELVAVEEISEEVQEDVSEEETSEEPKEEPPVIDENGVIHLTRTTKKGG